MKRCKECAAGEHDNYDDLVERVVVRDPEKKEKTIRGLMCEHHREMYLSDGYLIDIQPDFSVFGGIL